MIRLVLPYIAGRPIVDVHVGIGGLRGRAFAMQGRPAPSPAGLSFLADTGAEVSVIDLVSARHLGLRRIGVGRINTGTTGGTPAQCDEFEISLQIFDPATRIPAFSEASLTVLGMDLSAQPINGILGRDALDRGIATFHGPKQSLILDL